MSPINRTVLPLFKVGSEKIKASGLPTGSIFQSRVPYLPRFAINDFPVGWVMAAWALPILNSGNTKQKKKGSVETENIIATWRTPGIFKADPQKVCDELHDLGDEFLPEDIVEKAKDEDTELHKCFEWDNEVAAEKYRLHQARQITSNLVFRKETEEDEQPVLVRVYNKTEATGGYKPPERVFRQSDEYDKLLKRAVAELRQFKVKYSMLKELDYILSLIN